jgi:hypothetical protein
MMSNRLSHWFGKWWVCIMFGVIAAIIFTFIVPNAVSQLTENRTLAPLILDEYYPTWPASKAQPFFAALGDQGRLAYRAYYLTLDFWFPVLSLTIFYTALLSLAFPQNSHGRALNLAPLLMYVADMMENINHFTMAGSYPDLLGWQITIGPLLSLVKYVLITTLPLIALVGFWMNRGAGIAKGPQS